MSGRVDAVLEVLRRVFVEPIGRLRVALGAGGLALGAALLRFRWRLAVAAVLALIAYGAYQRPPFATATGSEVLVRANELDGTVTAYTAGTVLVLPGIHQVRRYAIRDQVYRLTEGASATGPAPFQSTEGLSIGVDLTVLARRAGVDPAPLAAQVTLGRWAASTRGNALEAAAWVRDHDIRTLIVVTAYYHMPRALTELRRALPGVTLYPEPVLRPQSGFLGPLVTLRLTAEEYTKYLLALLGVTAVLPVHEPTPPPEARRG